MKLELKKLVNINLVDNYNPGIELHQDYAFHWEASIGRVGSESANYFIFWIKTKSPVNGNTKAIREVYHIFEKWLVDSQKSDFRNLSTPLDGSGFCWLGQDSSYHALMKSEL